MSDRDSDHGESTGSDEQFSGSRRTILKSVGTLGAGGLLATEIDPVAAHESEDHLAQTPPMGWNSWNTFACDIDADLIKETADAMVESGMKEAGYEYVNIDDCWMAPERDEDGNLEPDPERFPNGIDAVADYVHDEDLKLGIYESAGTYTCQGYPGSLLHEKQDARSFADWGVDYLKYDNCGDHLGYSPRTRYDRMWNALEAVDRDIVKSQCSWGTYEEWQWAADFGANLWRTTGDITDSWSRIMDILDQQVGLARYAEPGHWNDPDMLEVGNEGLSTRESRSHFSLWCVLAAPLLAGNDIRDMDEETREILTNEEVIAIDQDQAGIQGTKRKDTGDHEIWAKPLENGDVAVCLLNRGETAGTISIDVDEFDLRNAAAYVLRDLWEKDEVATASTISASVPSHGVALYRVRPGTPDEAPPATTLRVENDDLTVTDGQTKQITTTLTNDGRLAIENVELSLSGPDEWEVSAETDATHHNTPPSKSVRTTWNVTVPENTVPGSYEFSLDATFKWQGNDAHSTSSTFALQAPLDPLPDGYETYASTDAEFGSVEERETVVVSANGEDVWSDVDQYGAVYRPGSRAAQNSTAVVKIHSQEDTSGWAKAGLMIRNDVTGAGESPGYAIVAVTPSHGFAFQWDGDADGYVENNATVGDSTSPAWLRLDRSGSTVTASYSTDGDTWTEIESADLPGADDVQDIAVFANSHSEGALSQVEFSDFAVDNEAGLAISAGEDELVSRGETTEISATFTNYRDQAAADLSLGLQPPDGWNVQATSDTTAARVAPGDSFTATWDVTAPTDTSAGDHEVTATASYTVDDTAQRVVGSHSLSVPPAPPTGDTYLSDHEWVSATIGWGEIGIDESVGDNPLTIGGRTYEKGIGTHAESTIDYFLDGNVSRFVADVGIDDEVESDVASARFRVVGDGDVLAETDVLGSGDAPVSLDVDVSSVDVLSLVVTDAGDTIDYDHADWAIAKVLA